MTTDAIIAATLRAATLLKTPVQEISSRALSDAYAAAKDYLAQKLRRNPDAADALEKATAKPDSSARAALLHEEARGVALGDDPELTTLFAALMALLPAVEPERPSVRVSGHGNRVQAAGRDFVVNTAKHYRRNVITPDERHLSREHREALRRIIREVAERLASDEGSPNFAAVHRMLQRRFNVPSYALIASSDFAAALAFLKQQRAIHRSRLLRRNPRAYAGDLFRVVFSRARELGWDRESVYRYAAEKLGLHRRITTLKNLGPNQLRSLVDHLRAEEVPAQQG